MGSVSSYPDPPDFGPLTGYPSQSEIVGPLWKLIWKLLCEATHPLRGAEVVELVHRTMPEANPATIKNLLSGAGVGGVLERTKVRGESRREVWAYRVL